MFKITKLSLKRLSPRCIRRSSIETIGLNYVKDDNPPKKVRLLPRPKYGGESTVTLLTGSTSIGKQGASYIRTLIDSAKVPISFERLIVPTDQAASHDMEYLLSVMRNRVAIHVELQHDPEQKQKSLMLNNDLDLYACIIKVFSIEGYNCRFPGADIMLVIQNNTGDYTKLEYEPVKGVVQTLTNTQDLYIRRYLTFVYKQAINNCREKITIGHKVAELPIIDGRFLEIAKSLHQKLCPCIELELMSVNDIVRKLTMCPKHFDMICTSDRYGTIIASVTAAVCGGAELFSAVEQGDHHAVFKPLQTKLSLTDTRVLSPYGIVRACIELLRYLNYNQCAQTLENELNETMVTRNIKTALFGGKNTGEFVICSIVNNLKCQFSE